MGTPWFKSQCKWRTLHDTFQMMTCINKTACILVTFTRDLFSPLSSSQQWHCMVVSMMGMLCIHVIYLTQSTDGVEVFHGHGQGYIQKPGLLFLVLVCTAQFHYCLCTYYVNLYYGLAVASPYVGMARFQDGGSNQCISVFMAISSPGNKY